MRAPRALGVGARRFQCSSASRKFLNTADGRVVAHRVHISVLFSEPKIPQCSVTLLGVEATSTFQCSSASRKFLNARHLQFVIVPVVHFSALQRAENSSMLAVEGDPEDFRRDFSALQRAENSSIDGGCVPSLRAARISVLFSEPKIPQYLGGTYYADLSNLFQCSSASRKFLNVSAVMFALKNRSRFQCSSASRKFLNPGGRWSNPHSTDSDFSALQRAENSSIFDARRTGIAHSNFSALQRAENSSIDGERLDALTYAPFQCSSASRKFLNKVRGAQRPAEERDFSALQRAENSSIRRARVSLRPRTDHFSALQRAENSSMARADRTD